MSFGGGTVRFVIALLAFRAFAKLIDAPAERAFQPPRVFGRRFDSSTQRIAENGRRCELVDTPSSVLSPAQ
jgi:hypothetical protein